MIILFYYPKRKCLKNGIKKMVWLLVSLSIGQMLILIFHLEDKCLSYMHFAFTTVPSKLKQNEVVAHCQSICSNFKESSLWNCSTIFPLSLFPPLEFIDSIYQGCHSRNTKKYYNTGLHLFSFFCGLCQYINHTPASHFLISHHKLFFCFCISNLY